ncbi:MAG: FKBP-type peptidyl-prolyl cis-trans isomerase [Bacteroidales bacterium]|nr:FKBP-type peptidyl-prolyl cis-trans isomerase [Bacteroidales bacterium]
MLLIRRHFIIFLFFFILVFCCKPKTYEEPEKDRGATKEQMIAVNRMLVRKDRQQIKDFIDSNSIAMTETPTGLWFNIDKEGEGPKVKAGDIIEIDYRITLLDGTECYNSQTDDTKKFRVGKGGVESGLEEAVLMLRKGSKAKFIMPPHLAHGLTGDGNKIPARAIIFYEVEVLSLE